MAVASMVAWLGWGLFLQFLPCCASSPHPHPSSRTSALSPTPTSPHFRLQGDEAPTPCSATIGSQPAARLQDLPRVPNGRVVFPQAQGPSEQSKRRTLRPQDDDDGGIPFGTYFLHMYFDTRDGASNLPTAYVCLWRMPVVCFGIMLCAGGACFCANA
jgi:hypothetical protein